MFEIGPYFALGSVGLGLAVFGYAMIKIVNVGVEKGQFEKDFYRIRDDNKAMIEEANRNEAEVKRIQEEFKNFKVQVTAAIESGDWNSVLRDAPHTLDDLHVSGLEPEESTHPNHEQGVLPVLEGSKSDDPQKRKGW